MLGLKRNTVLVVDYDPQWATLGLEACQTVRKACAGLLIDVQHVGSTAVPGLPAKPILDMAAAIATFQLLPELVRRLTAIGYHYRGDQGDAGGHLFHLDSPPDIRLIHLHVVEHNGLQWRNYLRFRDLLRQQPAICIEYAQYKRRLAELYPNNRELYTNSKAEFICNTLTFDSSPPYTER